MTQQTLEQLRKRLTELSDEYWDQYMASLTKQAPDEEGDEFIVLEGVDSTVQSDVEATDQYVLHRDPQRGLLAIPMKSAYNAMVSLLRETQSNFGWERQSRWDVVGVIAGECVTWDEYQEKLETEVPVVSARALRVPGQFVVFRDPKEGPRIPGLDKALQILEQSRAETEIPVVKNPPDLIPLVVKALGAANLELFRHLWISETSDRDVRYYYDQFQKAFAASNGQIAFEHYDARLNPEADPDCTQTKMFVKRTNIEGPPVTRPITAVKEGEGWRLKSGMI